MGNRFRDMPQYHSLIRAHGVIAAIVFLGLVPGAILIARFYGPSPYRARRYHMWMQSVTVLLSTVVFVLGWFAVGPQRSLTNPHHGIGLAIYVLIMFQMFWGWFVHKRLKDRQRPHIPLKLMVSTCHSEDSPYSSGLTCAVAPLDRPGYCPAGDRTDTPWTHPLWLAIVIIHFIRRDSIYAASHLLHPHLPPRAASCCRLLLPRQLFVRPRSCGR
jgi:hypothetical protein